MKVHVVDHVHAVSCKIDVEFTTHHQHSSTGRLIMVMHSGKELTPTLWRLYECTALVSNAREVRLLKRWKQIHSI